MRELRSRQDLKELEERTRLKWQDYSKGIGSKESQVRKTVMEKGKKGLLTIC
jgi:hypothetical protein